MLPQLVLLVETEAEVIQIIQIANRHNIQLTFRAAGTSLSGQAVTDQVLVVLSSASWQNIRLILPRIQSHSNPESLEHKQIVIWHRISVRLVRTLVD